MKIKQIIDPLGNVGSKPGRGSFVVIIILILVFLGSAYMYFKSQKQENPI